LYAGILTNPPQANLCRFFVNPSGGANYLIYANPPQTWVSDSILNKVALADQANHYPGLFLPNVIALYVNATQVDGATAYGGDSSTTGHLPAFVQISLVLLDTAAAARLNTSTVSVIHGLYSSCATASAFVAALPTSIRPDATVATINVNLANYK
jgi:hypothetical protein